MGKSNHWRARFVANRKFSRSICPNCRKKIPPELHGTHIARCKERK